jgi:glycosyltransferase involved in cell wall biosynthesis
VTTSVVITTYNYARFLPEAVASALAQTAPDVEVVVVDDGSTDDTQEVLARFAGRIRVHHQENAGVSAARNTGARLARGRYVVFLDADNRLRSEFVGRCLAALQADPAAGFAFTQLAYFGDHVGISSVEPYDLSLLLDSNPIDTCAMVRRSLVTTHGFDEGHRTFLEDWDFWLTLAEHGWHGVLVDEPLVEYRWHGANATTERSRLDRRRGKLRIYLRHRRLVGYRRLVVAAWDVARCLIGDRVRRR